MLEAVVDSALRDVWAKPEADLQFLVKPVPLCQKGGVLNTLFLDYVHIRMPENGVRYMVYQVGQIEPSRLGLESNIQEWKDLNSISNADGMLFQFVINHKVLSLEGAFVKRTKNRSLIFAIEFNQNADLIGSSYPALLHFYSNAWYATQDGATTDRPVSRSSLYKTDTGDPAFFTELYSAVGAGKVPLLYKNGYVTDTITPSEVSNLDCLHLIVDSSIEGYFEVLLSSLETYVSSEDSRVRYIIQVPDSQSDKIYFLDDLEVYLMGTKAVSPTLQRDFGLYLPRITKGNIMMLSHCDLAIETAYISNVINQDDSDISFNEPKIRIYYRKGMLPKEQIGDSVYFRQFYQIPAAQRLMLMTGTGANVDPWKATTLEQSKFIKFMSASLDQLTQMFANSDEEGVYDVYSYSGIMDIIENPKVINGNIHYSISDKLYGCIQLEFNSDGLLKNIVEKSDVDTLTTPSVPVGVKYIETLSGQLTTTSAVNAYDESDDYLGNMNEVRYVLTDTGHRKAISGIDYSVNPNNKKLLWDVKHNGRAKYKYRATDIIIDRRTLDRQQLTKAIPVFFENDPLELDLGFSEIAVIMDERRLVDGTDYLLEYPNLRILKGPDLNAPLELTIIVQGIPPQDDELYPSPQTGWITNLEISRNDKFDFYRKLDNVIYIDGRYVSPDNLKVAESGLGEMPTWVENGMPYAIYPRIQHIPSKFVLDVCRGRYWENNTVDAIEDAVTYISPESTVDGPVFVNGQYILISPLIHRILEDIKSGDLIITNKLSDAAIGLAMVPYIHLIDYDPSIQRTDQEFIDIVPTDVNTNHTVSLNQYHFIERVNEIYLESRCLITDYISIG